MELHQYLSGIATFFDCERPLVT